MLSEEQYQDRKETLEGMDIAAVWGASRPDEFMMGADYPFLKQKENFFWLLERLMNEGKIKLANSGVFWDGSVTEQISILKNIFPKTSAEMEDGAFDGFWFYSGKCPGGIVWVQDNGYLDWT